MKSFRSLGDNKFDVIVPFSIILDHQVLCVGLQALIVDHRSSNEGDLWVPLGNKPHFFVLLSVKFHPVAGAPRGDGIKAGLDV